MGHFPRHVLAVVYQSSQRDGRRDSLSRLSQSHIQTGQADWPFSLSRLSHHVLGRPVWGVQSKRPQTKTSPGVGLFRILEQPKLKKSSSSIFELELLEIGNFKISMLILCVFTTGTNFGNITTLSAIFWPIFQYTCA